MKKSTVIAGPWRRALLFAHRRHQADMDAAKALIEKHSKLPTFEAPGKPAFDAKACMADKKDVRHSADQRQPIQCRDQPGL